MSLVILVTRMGGNGRFELNVQGVVSEVALETRSGSGEYLKLSW